MSVATGYGQTDDSLREELTRARYALQLANAHAVCLTHPAEAVKLLQDETVCLPRLKDFSWKYLVGLTERGTELWKMEPHSTRTVDVWQREQSAPIAVYRSQTTPADLVSFSPNGDLVATYANGTISVWHAAGNEISYRFDNVGLVACLSFSGNGKRIVSAGDEITQWNLETGQPNFRRGSPEPKVTQLAVSFDAQQWLTADENGSVRLWSADENETPQTIVESTARLLTVDLTNDANRVAVLTHNWLSIYDAQSGDELWRRAQTRRRAWKMALFTPDSVSILTAGPHEPITLRDIASGVPQLKLMPYNGDAKYLRFADNGRVLVAGRHNGILMLWRFPSPTGNRLLVREARRLTVAPDGEHVAVTADAVIGNRGPNPFRTVDVESGQTVMSIDDVSVINLCYSPSGKLIAGLLEGGDVQVWDARTGEATAQREGTTQGEAICFVTDRRLAYASGHNDVVLWDLDTDHIDTLNGDDGEARCLAVSPDGRFLAAGYGIYPLPPLVPPRGDSWVFPPGKVVLWNLETHQKARELEGHKSYGVYAVAFSPDGKTLASCGEGIILWDTETFDPRLTIDSLPAPIWSAAYSPDGRTLATGGLTNSIRLWDPVTGDQRMAMTGLGFVTSLQFSPDGGTLYSASLDGIARLWPGQESAPNRSQ